MNPMKRLLVLFFVCAMSCSDNEPDWNFVHVEIIEPSINKEISAGEKVRLVAHVTTPNTLRTVSMFLGNQEISVKSVHPSQEHFLDTTFRTDPTASSIALKVRAEDNVGNFSDRVTLNFTPYELPQACVQTNGISVVVVLPDHTPIEDNVYMHGDFNNYLFGDSNYKLVPIPETNNCACASIRKSSDVSWIQFNRGTETSINQSNNCGNALNGVSNFPLNGIIITKWKDLDCN